MSVKTLFAIMLVAACGDNQTALRLDGSTDDAAHSDSRVADTSMVDAGPRGPAVFALPGVSYGLAWDATAEALYITDDTNRRLDKWTDADGVTAFSAALPTVSGATVLGDLVQLADKSFYTPNLGQGTAGTIFTISADGATTGALTGLDVARRRVGIALDGSAELHEAYFTGNMAGSQTGGLASVAIAAGVGTEVPVTTSTALKRTTGIAVVGTTAYVCDQTDNKIYAVALPAGTVTTLASLPSCDLIHVMPNGDLVTGGITGGVYRITAAGAVTNVRSGFEVVRGIAYDNVMKRMFIVEHRATAPTMPRLHVFPLDS